MAGNWWLALIFALVGAGSWLAERRAQRQAKAGLLVVRPWCWVARLCGDPRRDGTIDLESGLKQLSALVFLLGGPLSMLLPLELHLQAAVVFLVYALVALPVSILVGWARWRAEGAQEPSGRLRSRSPGAYDLN